MNRIEIAGPKPEICIEDYVEAVLLTIAICILSRLYSKLQNVFRQVFIPLLESSKASKGINSIDIYSFSEDKSKSTYGRNRGRRRHEWQSTTPASWVREVQAYYSAISIDKNNSFPHKKRRRNISVLKNRPLDEEEDEAHSMAKLKIGGYDY